MIIKMIKIITKIKIKKVIINKNKNYNQSISRSVGWSFAGRSAGQSVSQFGLFIQLRPKHVKQNTINIK